MDFVLEQAEDDVPVPDGVHGRHEHLVERQVRDAGLPIGAQLLLPCLPLVLLVVDVVVVHGVGVREHGLDVSDGVVEDDPALLVDRGPDRPDDGENEPFL